MATSLQRLFEAIAQTRSVTEVRSRFMDTLAPAFDVDRWGIYLFDDGGELTSVDIHGIDRPGAFVDRYRREGMAVDPVLKYVTAHHAPAHLGMVMNPADWPQSELYQRCCADYDHEHFMVGPIVAQGRMVGAMYFSRLWGTPAFDLPDVQKLGALGAHLSAQLAGLSAVPKKLDRHLSPREQQLVRLVAQGLTNREISQRLWIQPDSVKKALTRIYRKLGVPNRAALVAKLLSNSAD